MMAVKITQTDCEIIFKREYCPVRNADSSVVRISGEAHDALMIWSNKTGLSVSKLASEFILFAAERSRIGIANERT